MENQVDNPPQEQQEGDEIVRVKNSETITFQEIPFDDGRMKVRISKIRKRSRFIFNSGREIKIKSVAYKAQIVRTNE